MGLFHYIATFLVGLCFGSFANVVAYRLPLGKSIIHPPSSCPSCSRRLGGMDLIPVLSWVLLLARCRYCGAKIPLSYPLAELVCGLLFLGMSYFFVSLSYIPLAFLAFVLLTVTLTDINTRTIPDGLLIAGAIAGVLWIGLSVVFPAHFLQAPSWRSALFGVLTGGIPLIILDRVSLYLFNKDGFGFGDVKLMAMIGIFLGWRLVLVAFFVAFVSAGIIASLLLFLNKVKRGDYIAFGPYLCAGSLFSLWFGDEIIVMLYFS